MSVHGFSRGTPVRRKSSTLRVTTQRSCRIAVAAINRSGCGKVGHMAFPSSTRRRQITKTSPSTSSSRSENQGRSSFVSHASSRFRDGSTAASRSMPYLISAIVTLLKNKLVGCWLSDHALTCVSQLGLRSSEITFVSRSQPLTTRHRAPTSGRFRAQNPSLAAATDRAAHAGLAEPLPEQDARKPRQKGSPPHPCRAKLHAAAHVPEPLARAG